MAGKRVTLTFSEELLKEPIIYNLIQQFGVSVNIHRAEVSESKGWMIIELEGDEIGIEEGLAWVTSRGIRVDPNVGETG